MATDTTSPPAIRKAAILLRTLQPEAAALLLADLSPEEARAVRQAIRELGDVRDDEHQGVLAELRATATDKGPATSEPGVIHADEAGVELQLTATGLEDAAALHSAVPNDGPGPATPRSVADPFALAPELEDVEPGTLAGYLAREGVGVVAVVLSHLSPARAAAVLDELPRDLRVSAIDRLSSLGDGDDQSLRVVADDIASWVRQQQSERRRRASRMATIQAILGAASHAGRADIVDGLVERGRDWAATLAAAEPTPPPATQPPAATEPQARADATSESAAEAPLPEGKNETAAAADQNDEQNGDEQTGEETTVGQNAAARQAAASYAADSGDATAEPTTETAQTAARLSVPFAAVHRLETPLLAQVMKRTPPRQLLLALAGAAEAFQSRIESLIPNRQVRLLRRQLDALGPTTLHEVEAAQHAMAQSASELWDFYYGKRAA
ncbi:MAG: FliG C-terminal domain-containing protein [Planctomycetota bacterium]